MPTQGFMLTKRPPPGGRWRYRDWDTGEVIEHPYYSVVKARAHGYRVKQGLPIPSNWDARFDAILCQEVPAGCTQIPVVPEVVPPSLTDRAKTFAKASLTWARQGFPVVSWEDFAKRSRTCQGGVDDDGNEVQRCPAYHPGGAFGFGTCGKCGCTKVKLWWATERCPLGKW